MIFAVDSKVKLLCKIANLRLFATAKWIREKTKRILVTANFSYDEHFTLSYHQFPYEINKVSTEDKGIYTCVANFSDYGPVKAWYELQVRGKWCYNCIYVLHG